MKHKSILIPAAFAAMAATASAAPMEWSEVLLKSASNVGMVRTPVCGIVLEHHGCGCGRCEREKGQMVTNFQNFAVREGWLFLHVRTGSNWTNSSMVDLTDRVVESAIARYGLKPDVPILSTGYSMGGMGAIVWPAYSKYRDNVRAVFANCPVTDLAAQYKFAAAHTNKWGRFLAKTIESAYPRVAGTPYDETLNVRSPIHILDRLAYVPYYINHAMQDTAVPMKMHSDVFVPLLKKFRSRVTYYQSDGQGHCGISGSVAPQWNAALQSEMAAAEKPIVGFKTTGTMKEDAYRGLCRMPDGEIRHYGRDVRTGARVYASSRDGGRNWIECRAKTKWEDAMVRCPWSGMWVTIRSRERKGGSLVIRSKNGPGDPNSVTNVVSLPNFSFNRQPVPLKSRHRLLSPGNVIDGEYFAAVAISDDDGLTWRLNVLRNNVRVGGIVPPDKMRRWENYCCEPTLLEMKDGSIWLVVRTTLGHHYRYISKDGGDTWGEPTPMPGFYASNTMPLLHRLKDGRILFFWNNTAPLPTPDPKDYPELGDGELSGRGEAAFTNRDAWHAAISEDEGKTWRGFRELRLLDFSTRADFRQYGMSQGHELDKSVHQSQAVELEDGRLVMSDGQSPMARRLGVFDPAFLYETGRTEDFRDGLVKLTTHLFVKSYCGDTRFKGHCCWNRTNGALLVPDPVEYLSKREVLQLCRIDDPRLVSTRQGAVWNFPVARAVTRSSMSATCASSSTASPRRAT